MLHVSLIGRCDNLTEQTLKLNEIQIEVTKVRQSEYMLSGGNGLYLRVN